MAQAAANPTTNFTRRSALAISFGAALVPLSAPDPVFAAIARVKRAEADYEAALDRGERDTKNARRRCDNAALALLSALPTTHSGLVALLCFIRRNQEAGLTCECAAFLRTVEAVGGPVLDALEA